MGDHSCDEVKGTPSFQAVRNELVTGQKLLEKDLQRQQKLPADHIKHQKAALDKQQQTFAELMSFTSQQWSQPDHQQRDCTRIQNGQDNSF